MYETVTDDLTMIGCRLDRTLFDELAGELAGYPYVKIVIDRIQRTWHVLDTKVHTFHAQYIATKINGITLQQLEDDLDYFNASVYTDPNRRFMLGILSVRTLSPRSGKAVVDIGTHEESFMVLETTDGDTMGASLLTDFYTFVRENLDRDIKLVLMPATHAQEIELESVPPNLVPRISSHDIFARSNYMVLNIAFNLGRLRYFSSAKAYQEERDTLMWHDIVAMPVVPDNIPRVAGIINGEPVSPLSHTNVLAAGWGIPNSIIRDIEVRVHEDDLDGSWVRYEVTSKGLMIEKSPAPQNLEEPNWNSAQIKLCPPDLGISSISLLSQLRVTDRHRYGTKAANIGELHHLLLNGSRNLTSFYTTPRHPRKNLLPYLADRLQSPSEAETLTDASTFIGKTLSAPSGLALPFWMQQCFLNSNPAIIRSIDELRKALREGELSVLDGLCREIQENIRSTDIPAAISAEIESKVALNLTISSTLVVRSSSNAEDLEGFSAAGIYESVGGVSDFSGLSSAIRQVWASLFSQRSVSLRHQAGIALQDAYMGVIIQEYTPAALGGVMVTCDPARPDDFRNVYINCTENSVSAVVDGTVIPIQYLYNTVEGGGRTLSFGSATEDLDTSTKEKLGSLALAGRLLQSHFSSGKQDISALDIEWLLSASGILQVLQIRPYSI